MVTNEVKAATILIYELFKIMGLTMQEGYDTACLIKSDIERIALEKNKPLKVSTDGR